jgi:hypothetical protein
MTTSPLGTALRDLGGSADPGRLPPPADVRAAGDRRRRRTTLGVAAGSAVAIASAILVASALGGPDPTPRPVEPLPTPTPTGRSTAAPTTGVPGTGSGTYPIASEGVRFSVNAVAAHGGTFVVVGDSSDLEGPFGPPVYWSEDGIEWQPPVKGRSPDTVNVTDVIATSEGFVAVGAGGADALAWHSADGRTWTEAPVATSGGDAALWGVTETSLGYYAWGFVDRRAHLWRSVDGEAWAGVADEPVFDLSQSETICAVREERGGLMATGVVAPKNSREGRSVAWTSADGETWVLAEPPGDPTMWCDSTKELGHWEARTSVGLVEIEPYGPGDVVHFTVVDE